MTRCAAAVISLLLCLGCEKAVFDAGDDTGSQPLDTTHANVILNIASDVYPYESLTRSVVPITDHCSTINVVLYQNGDKSKWVTQKKGEENYGKVAWTLEPGTYKLLVLAHSSKGNPSLADATNIHFTNEDRFSDTFYYYDDIEVKEASQTYDIMLHRASTAVKMYFEAPYPEGLYRIKVYYMGGSGVFNAVSGYGGAVNSQQEASFGVAEEVLAQEPITIPMYTFLQNDTGKMKIKVSAQDVNGGIIKEKTYDDVPVEKNKQTSFKGRFFDTEAGFNLSAETDWEELTVLGY